MPPRLEQQHEIRCISMVAVRWMIFSLRIARSASAGSLTVTSSLVVVVCGNSCGIAVCLPRPHGPTG